MALRPGRALAVLLASCLLGGGAAATARAGVANAGLPGASAANPLAGIQWGLYTGSLDGLYPAYEQATGQIRQLLGRIALQPSTRWFGAWYADSSAKQVAQQYIANMTGGNPDVLAQLAVFRLSPWEAQSCQRLPTSAEQASYRTWINNFAAGIGGARVALVLQPDLPFAPCNPDGGHTALALVNYAATRFSALPHTTVYIDVGAGDWPSVPQAVALLEAAGVARARGFALNATHYDSVPNELVFGARVSGALAASGVLGKHFVINTAENGSPWTYHQYHGNHANPRPCKSKVDWPCATLGIPPTWHVVDPRLHLSPSARRIARRLCDAYLWIGRPWLDNGAWPFDLARALALARSTPFQ